MNLFGGFNLGSTLASALDCIIPCFTPALCFVCILVAIGHFRSGMLYQGVVPSDGPAEFKGFTSKQERIDFWDTGPRRLRGLIKSTLILAGVGILGGGVIWGLYALVKAAVS